MEIENIEQWVGRDVVDADGESVGKLEEVYFRGEEAVLAEIKPGKLSRKRLIVPLAGASVSRDFVRLNLRSDALMQEASSGAGLDPDDVSAVGDHYGPQYAYPLEELDTSSARNERAAARAEALQRANDLEAAAAAAQQHTTQARERRDIAQSELEGAERAEHDAVNEARAARAEAGSA